MKTARKIIIIVVALCENNKKCNFLNLVYQTLLLIKLYQIKMRAVFKCFSYKYV